MGEINKKYKVVFAGGGTGGHIYPGIAVADSLKLLAKEKNVELEIHWIGNSKGMDRSIVEKNLESCGGSLFAFHGIPCGKLRRYFSFENFIDLFKICAGLIKAFFILKKIKPDFMFSKGGFVSVPPCKAAKVLKIPFFTHECDFTPGLATRLNSSGARKVLVSYEETKKYFGPVVQSKCVVTGNPVRPVFYSDNAQAGLKFLGISPDHQKPVLLVLGGSLGALQINNLVVENLEELKKNYIVVHQTGKKFADENKEIMESGDDSYKPYAFIYSEMPSVIQSADVVLSRSGANSLWECAVCAKPMILVPLCGNGTRGDQVDNARNFENQGGAIVLAGEDANSGNLLKSLNTMLDGEERKKFSENCRKICGTEIPSNKIASLIMEEMGL